MDITHDELIEKGAAWLRKQGASIVITDMAHSSTETPDVIGWQGTYSTMIEVKVSRSDFAADKKKSFRRNPEQGMGSLRYMLVPKGLVNELEVPVGWGLLEWSGRTVRRKKKPEHQTSNKNAELSIMISAVRRIGQNPPEGVSVKAYTYQTKNRATIGIAKK